MLEFGVAPKTALNIWHVKNDGVPGGVLKYETSSEEELLYHSELQTMTMVLPLCWNVIP